MPTIFTQVHDGEWIEPTPNHKIACCDCGLVHSIQFRVVAGKVQFRAWRDPKATRDRRREIKLSRQTKTKVKPCPLKS